MDEDYESYEPDADEIGAMRDAELAFRADNDLLDDDAWDAYCEDVGQQWLASQDVEDVTQRARAFILADMQSRVQAQQAAPNPTTTAASVPVEERWPYELTPIEAKFYDVLAETGLTFSVQPWMQHADRKYRADFVIWYDGRTVVVELDGHESHKTKEQRGKDARRDRWMLARGIRVVRFTGSEVWADADTCVRELLDVVRQSQARP